MATALRSASGSHASRGPLRRAIVRLELAPGTEISEQQLADALRAVQGERPVGARAAAGRGARARRAAPRPRRRAADAARRRATSTSCGCCVEPAGRGRRGGGVRTPRRSAGLRAPLADHGRRRRPGVDRPLPRLRTARCTSRSRAPRATAGWRRSWSGCSTTPSARSGSRCARARRARGLRVRGEHEALLDAIALPATRRPRERLMRAAIARFRDELIATLGDSPAIQAASLVSIRRRAAGAQVPARQVGDRRAVALAVRRADEDEPGDQRDRHQEEDADDVAGEREHDRERREHERPARSGARGSAAAGCGSARTLRGDLARVVARARTTGRSSARRRTARGARRTRT